MLLRLFLKISVQSGCQAYHRTWRESIISSASKSKGSHPLVQVCQRFQSSDLFFVGSLLSFPLITYSRDSGVSILLQPTSSSVWPRQLFYYNQTCRTLSRSAARRETSRNVEQVVKKALPLIHSHLDSCLWILVLGIILQGFFCAHKSTRYNRIKWNVLSAVKIRWAPWRHNQIQSMVASYLMLGYLLVSITPSLSSIFLCKRWES